jgi:hypothetical protein
VSYRGATSRLKNIFRAEWNFGRERGYVRNGEGHEAGRGHMTRRRVQQKWERGGENGDEQQFHLKGLNFQFFCGDFKALLFSLHPNLHALQAAVQLSYCCPRNGKAPIR